MNALVNLNTDPTMTSIEFLDQIINPAREDAGETPHEPRKFLIKIEDELDLNETGKKVRLNNNQTKSYFYDLTKDQMMLVGMRESKAVRRQVLAKLKSMESVKVHLPQSFAEALRLAADQAERIEQQQLLIEQQKPAVEFVGKYVTASSGNMTFRATAKILNINEREFRTFLRDNKIMYLLGGDWVPYQAHIEAGRFEIKAGLAEHDEKSHAFKQSKFTPKGVEWVAGEYAKHIASKALKSQEVAA